MLNYSISKIIKGNDFYAGTSLFKSFAAKDKSPFASVFCKKFFDVWVILGVLGFCYSDANAAITLTCPEPIVVSTSTTSCTADVVLPNINGTTTCSSGGLTITPTWEFGTGYNTFTGIPVGTYTITYNATDACGATSSCTTTITVKDLVAPIPLCRSSMSLPIGNGDSTTVFAHIFNNGSFDNCAIDVFRVSRDNGTFQPWVNFRCNDVNQPGILITMRAFDDAGNFNDCQLLVHVVDNLAPVVTAPADVTIDCNQSIYDLNVTGRATTTDNCLQSPVLTYVDVNNTNVCGVGTIQRTWKATDASNNLGTKVQNITIVPLNTTQVTFPSDFIANDCTTLVDTATTGRPIITGQSCDGVSITYTDQFQYQSFPACYKILRFWEVTDYCIYNTADPNAGGRWNHIQTIKIEDIYPPTIEAPVDLTVNITGNTCIASVNVPTATVHDCSPDLTLTNDSPYAFSNQGGNISGNYPKGNYVITFTATDGCGNIRNQTMNLTVKDVKAPTPVCLSGFSLPVDPNGIITITPQMIGNGATDNCTPSNEIELWVEPSTFNCSNLGTHLVRIYAKDTDGNSNYCETSVTIQDNANYCENLQNFISGKVTTANSMALPNAKVHLTDKNGLNYTTTTDSNGDYTFTGLPLGNAYYLNADKVDLTSNGVTTLDLVIARKEILGLEAFSNNTMYVASDVNASSSITTLDLVMMRKLILGIVDTLGIPAWQFVNKNFPFDNSNSIYNQMHDAQTITIENFTNSLQNIDFTAIKAADLNYSAILTNELNDPNADNRNKNVENLIIQDKFAVQDEIIPVTLRLQDQSKIGFQYSLEFDANLLSFENISELIDDEILENISLHQLDRNRINVSWDNPNLSVLNKMPEITFNFRVIKSGYLSQAIWLGTSDIKPECYAQNGKNYDVQQLKLKFEPTNSSDNAISDCTAYPNPFDDNLTIQFHANQQIDYQIKLWDLNGQLKHTGFIKSELGTNTYKIDKDILKDINGAVLFYEISTPSFRP
ncbi:MAG: carboxypeptidase regulatory-like domain-containing protein, partial [Saprospiraceae bacterium]|nr:carboxypeptidase regulatory-like domain-containing protein [Saprospiraceae bacterium]